MNLQSFVFRMLLGRRLLIANGVLKISGIGGLIVIRRDSYGISHSDAYREENA